MKDYLSAIMNIYRLIGSVELIGLRVTKIFISEKLWNAILDQNGLMLAKSDGEENQLFSVPVGMMSDLKDYEWLARIETKPNE